MESVHFLRKHKGEPQTWSDILYSFHRKNDERPFGTDCDVMCKGGYIPVHSWVLMAASDMLKEHLMTQSRSEREHMVVHLPDYDIADVTPVIFLFYTGMCLIPRKNIQLIFEIIESLGVSTTNENIKFKTPCNEDLQHKCSIRRYLDCDDESFDEDDDDEPINPESNLSSETVALQNNVASEYRNKIQNVSTPAQSSSSQKQNSPSNNKSSFCPPGPSSVSKNINVRTDSSSKDNISVRNGDCGASSSSSNSFPLTKKSVPEPKIARAVKVMRDGNTVKLIHDVDSNYLDTTTKEQNKSHHQQNNTVKNNDKRDTDNLDSNSINSNHKQNNDHFEDSNHRMDEEDKEQEDVEKERLINKNKTSKKRDSNEKNNKRTLVSDDSEKEKDEEDSEEDEDKEDHDTTQKLSRKTMTTNKRKITPTRSSPPNIKGFKRPKKSESPAHSDKSQNEDESSSSEYKGEESETEDDEIEDEDLEEEKSESADDDSESSIDKEKILRHGTRTRPVKESRDNNRKKKTRHSKKDESTSPQIKHRLRRRENSKSNPQTEDDDEEEDEEEEDDDEVSDYSSKTSNSKSVNLRRSSRRKSRKCTKPKKVKCPVCKCFQANKFFHYHIKNCGVHLKMNIDARRCKICNQNFPDLSLVEFVKHVKKCKPAKEDSDEDDEEEEDEDDAKDKNGNEERENDKENEENSASSESSDSSNEDHRDRNRKRKNKVVSDDSCDDKEEHKSTKKSTCTSPLKPNENIDTGDNNNGSEGDVEAEECLTFFEAYVAVERLPKSEVEKYLAKYLKSLEVHENDERLSDSEERSSSASSTTSTKTTNLNRESQPKKSDKNNLATAREGRKEKEKDTSDTEVLSSSSTSNTIPTSIINTSKTSVNNTEISKSQTPTTATTTTKRTINRETILKRTKSLFSSMRTCPSCNKGFNNCKFAMHCLLTHRLRRCWICLQTFHDSTTNDENHFQSKHSLGEGKKDQALCPICENEVPWKNIQKHIITDHFQDLLNDNNETLPLSKETLEKSPKKNSTIHNQVPTTNKNNNNSNKNNDRNNTNTNKDDDDDEDEDEEENSSLPRLKIKDPALLFESDDEDKSDDSPRPTSATTSQQPSRKGVQASNESNQTLPVYVTENQQQQSRQLNPIPPHAVPISTTNTNSASVVAPIPSEHNRQRVAATIPNRTPPLSYTLRGPTPQPQSLMTARVSGELRSGAAALFSGTVFQQPQQQFHQQNSVRISQPQTSVPNINYNNNNTSYNTTSSSSTHAFRPNNNNSAHFNNQNLNNNSQNFQQRFSTPVNNVNPFNTVSNNLMGQHQQQQQQQQPDPEAIADNIRNLLYNNTHANTPSPQSSPVIAHHQAPMSSAPVCLSSNSASRTLLAPARGANSAVVLSSRNLPPVTNPQSAVAIPTHHYQQQQQLRNPSDYHNLHHQQQPPPLIQQQQQVYQQQQQQQQQFYPSSNVQNNNNNNNMALMATNNMHLNNRNNPPPLSSTGNNNNSATYFGKTTIAGVPFKVYQRPENSVPHPGAVCSISTAPAPNGGYVATSIHPAPMQDLNRPSITYPAPNTEGNMNNNNQVNQNINLTYPTSTNMIASTSNNQNPSTSGGTTNAENFACKQCEQYFSCASSLDNHICFSLD